MTFLNSIIDSELSKIAFIALVIVPIYWKLGVFKRNGNGNGIVNKLEKHEVDIEKLFTHASIANREMGEIKDHIGEMKIDIRETKTDINWIKEKLK